MLVLTGWSDQSNCCGHGLLSFLYRESWAPFCLDSYSTLQMKMKTRLIHKICPRQVFSHSCPSNKCSITYMIKECPPSPTCLSQQPSPWTVPLFFPLAHVRNLTTSFLPCILPLHALSVILAMTLSPWYLSLSPTVLHLPGHCESLPTLPLTGSITTACDWSSQFCHRDLSETWRTFILPTQNFPVPPSQSWNEAHHSYHGFKGTTIWGHNLNKPMFIFPPHYSLQLRSYSKDIFTCLKEDLSFKKKDLLILLDTCGCFESMFICVIHVCLVPTKSKEGAGSPGTRVADCCELLCGAGNWTLVLWKSSQCS